LRVRHTRQKTLGSHVLVSVSGNPPFNTLSLLPFLCLCVYCNVENIGRCRRTSKSYERVKERERERERERAVQQQEQEHIGAGTESGAGAGAGTGMTTGASGSGWRVYTCRDKNKTWQSTQPTANSRGS